MSLRQSAETAVEAPLGELERALIDGFIRQRGYDPLQLETLPEAERTTILKDASVYASGKLMEIEARSHFLDEMHAHAAGVH